MWSRGSAERRRAPLGEFVPKNVDLIKKSSDIYTYINHFLKGPDLPSCDTFRVNNEQNRTRNANKKLKLYTYAMELFLFSVTMWAMASIAYIKIYDTKGFGFAMQKRFLVKEHSILRKIFRKEQNAWGWILSYLTVIPALCWISIAIVSSLLFIVDLLAKGAISKNIPEMTYFVLFLVGFVPYEIYYLGISIWSEFLDNNRLHYTEQDKAEIQRIKSDLKKHRKFIVNKKQIKKRLEAKKKNEFSLFDRTLSDYADGQLKKVVEERGFQVFEIVPFVSKHEGYFIQLELGYGSYFADVQLHEDHYKYSIYPKGKCPNDDILIKGENLYIEKLDDGFVYSTLIDEIRKLMNRRF